MSTRRQFLAGLAATTAAGWLATRGLARAAESNLMNWPSRAIELPDDEESQRPPVVTALRLHPRGEELATAGDDHLVRVWRLSDGKLLHRLAVHTDWVRTVDYTPDGQTLASAGNDRRIIFSDAVTGQKRDEFAEHPQAIAAIRFSHDGARLAAVGFEGTIRLYDVATKRLIADAAAPCRDMRTVAFSPTDAEVAAGGRCGTIRFCSTSSGHVIRDVAAHRQRVRAVAYSPDGSYLASTGDDRTVHILPQADGTTSFALPDRGAKVLALAFCGPNQLTVAGSDNLIRVWDVAARRETGVLAGHTGTIAALECQGKVLVSAGYDTAVRIWTIDDHVAAANSLPARIVRPAVPALPTTR